jgi:hypothetical protein
LLAMVKLARVAGPHVGALEVPYEGGPELGPAVDTPSREVLDPGTRRVGEVRRDALDDEQIVCRPAVVASEAIVLKPYARVCLPIVLHNGGRSMISS